MENDFNKYIEEITTSLSNLYFLDLDMFKNKNKVIQYCKKAYDLNEIPEFVAEQIINNKSFLIFNSPKELKLSYQQGKNSFSNGEKINNNPYDNTEIKNELFQEWNKGWNDESYDNHLQEENCLFHLFNNIVI